ncbi:hypothetical protein [Campylobacter molothri]|uniref:Uncharacterized protein n=1 Tax=Campylobacter molothri TaxID=1032242 RepID=A0ACC5W141_9BACT|nr:hypothetical protein [Campylobacter sp. RM10537]MBZ7942890.1 hypothetical protein [Campylobacter sp. W0045]MBZ7949679.1 hypothetical protein [Campylobacter sp. RM10534]MBZ7953006.1 hypothetical protein [Campylobacter sp. RM9939]MBZ7974604.1 hypothetical protein [Campylobacter sp. RM9754]
MDEKNLNLLKNIPYLMKKIEELESRIKKLEQTQQPQCYSTQTPDQIGKI